MKDLILPTGQVLAFKVEGKSTPDTRRLVERMKAEALEHYNSLVACGVPDWVAGDMTLFNVAQAWERTIEEMRSQGIIGKDELLNPGEMTFVEDNGRHN